MWCFESVVSGALVAPQLEPVIFRLALAAPQLGSVIVRLALVAPQLEPGIARLALVVAALPQGAGATSVSPGATPFCLPSDEWFESSFCFVPASLRHLELMS